MPDTVRFEDWAAQQGIGLSELAKINAAGIRLPVIFEKNGEATLPEDFVRVADIDLLFRALQIKPRMEVHTDDHRDPSGADQSVRRPKKHTKPLKRPSKGRQQLYFDPAELPPDALLTVKDVAAWSGFSVVSIERRRRLGQEPRFQRLAPSGAIRYRVADVAAWLEAGR